MSGNTFGRLFTVTSLVRATDWVWAASLTAVRPDSSCRPAICSTILIGGNPVPLALPPSAKSPMRCRFYRVFLRVGPQELPLAC